MNDLAAPVNPFASAPVAAAPSAVSQASNAIAASDQSRAIAEVQASMMIARANPRDQIVAVDRILNACSRPSLAESALYSYSRGGTDITGPSIRLAEALAQSWGNVSYGIRELDQRGGVSTVQAFAWDVETNTRREMTFQVAHVRHTKRGAYALEDPRDIYEMVANQGARRLRACILGILPGDVIDAAVKQCDVTLKARVEVTPELIASIVEKFSTYAVTKEMIEARIQRRIDAITPGLVVGLGKILNSLKDGMSAPGDWFDMTLHSPSAGDGPAAPTPASRTDAVKEKARKAATSTTTAQAGPTDAQKPAQAAPTSGAPAVTFAEVAGALEGAQDRDAFDAACDLIQHVSDLKQRDELSVIVKRRLADFKSDGA